MPGTAPLRHWWNVVRSWQQPSLSLAVALCTLLWAAFPRQGTVLALVLAAAAMVGYKAMVLSATDLGTPQPMAEDLPAEPDGGGSAQQAGAATGAGGEAGAEGGVHQSPSQPSLLSRSLQQQGGSGSAGAGAASSSGGQPGASAGATQGGGGTGGALSSFFGGSSSAASAAVPMDTLDSLKSQYEGVVSFLALVRRPLGWLGVRGG